MLKHLHLIGVSHSAVLSFANARLCCYQLLLRHLSEIDIDLRLKRISFDV